ncbi:ribonuclease P protein component [Kluyveromyces marxianus]|nr:ribonuclease P protein component [Kluyveromyces marxianus]
MHFKSLKYKFYCKGYHSAAHKSATSFFDSSYQYLRQNQGLVNLDSSIPPHNILSATPHPVVGANVNYNNVERALQKNDRELQQIEQYDIEKDDEFFSHHERRLSNQMGTGVNINKGQKQRSKSFTYAANEKTDLINGKLSTRYYSTTTTTTTQPPPNQGPNVSPTQIQSEALDVDPSKHNRKELEEQGGLEGLLQRLKDTRLDDSIPAWEPDYEVTLNKDAFLATQSKLIDDCMKSRNYNQVNAIYQSLKRNEIVPPLPVFEQVLTSICKRDMDQNNIDNKMFELLNCYQDIIQNKLKPSFEIYHLVVGALLSGSIKAFQLHNTNGLDFFKIAIDLFFVSSLNRNKSFDSQFLNDFLLAVNLYPGHVKFNYIKNFIDSNVNYTKDEVYYITLFSYAKMLNEHEAVKDLYQDFRSELLKNPKLAEHQYEVYAVILAAFTETGSLGIATKLLDKLLIDLQSKNGHNKNTYLVLSNFLISVGKINSDKAYSLLTEFSKLKWVPEFSYEFYLVMIANSLNTNWPLVKKIYNYIFAMETSFSSEKDPNMIKNFLLYPSGLESMPSTILTYAFRQKDDEFIMKILEESVIKEYTFQKGLYPYIFNYFKGIKCPEPYLFRFIRSHGVKLHSINKNSTFDFLNAIVEEYQSQPVLKKVTEMPFFKSACESFNLENAATINFAGLIVCFQTLWKTPQLIQEYASNLDLHGLIVSRLYDLDTYYLNIQNEMLLEFKKQMAEKFQKLCINYKRMHLDATKVSPITVQAMKMVDMSADTLDYFQHPGDWDKSYPLSLGPLLRNSRTGIQQFERLSDDGYLFDYDTYSQLIFLKYITTDIITNAISLCPDKATLKYICNTMVVKCPRNSLEDCIVNHPLFSETIVKQLTDKSLSRLSLYSTDIKSLIKSIDFPNRFKSIASQAEYSNTISSIFKTLFRNKDYDAVLDFNKTVPCLDVCLVLKSLIRLGNYSTYLSELKKFKNTLPPGMFPVIHSEYLINRGNFADAMSLLKSSPDIVSHQTYDKYSFAMFLLSFNGNPPRIDFDIENTLQLANVLTSFNSFSNIIDCYKRVTKSGYFSRNSQNNHSVRKEILQQMLNNIEDSMSFVDLEDASILRIYETKLQNYVRFRVSLRMNLFNSDEMLQMINIWKKINPVLIDDLFNDIVSSFYLNHEIKTITFMKSGVLELNKETLLQLLDSISNVYQQENLVEHQTKVQQFRDIVLSSLP